MNDELAQKAEWHRVGKYSVTSELFLDLIFTETCNAACPFCIARTEKRAVPDYEKWRESLRRAFAEYEIRSVIILGGEATVDPLFERRLNELERVLPEPGPRNIILTTNGIRLRDPAFLDMLCRTRINSVNLSYMNEDKGVNDGIFHADTLTAEEIRHIYGILKEHGKTMRINTNVYRGNLDSPEQMENFVRFFSGCCDAIKFSPLMRTDMFGTVKAVTAYTAEKAIPESEIRVLYNRFLARREHAETAPGILGYIDYAETEVDGQRVILKFGQVEDKYDRDYVIPTLKLYPNGTLSNEWSCEKNILI